MYRGMNSARMDGPGAKMSIPRRGSTPRWLLQNEKGKDVYSRSQNIFICRDVIPLFRDKWRPISVKNRFLRTCLLFSNVRN